jgi:hypothetical protein
VSTFRLPPRARNVVSVAGDSFGTVYAATTGDTENVFVLAPDAGSFLAVDGGGFSPVGLLVTRGGWAHVLEEGQVQSCFRRCTQLADFALRIPPLGLSERVVGGCLSGEEPWLLVAGGSSAAVLGPAVDGGWQRVDLDSVFTPKSCAIGPSGEVLAVAGGVLILARPGVPAAPIAVPGASAITPDWSRAVWGRARGLERQVVIGSVARVAERQADGGWSTVVSPASGMVNWRAADATNPEEMVVVGSEQRGGPNVLVLRLDGGQQLLSLNFANLETVFVQDDNTFFFGGQQLNSVGGVVGAALGVGRR